MIDASILIYKAYSTFILKLVAHNITRRPSDYRLMMEFFAFRNSYIYQPYRS